MVNLPLCRHNAKKKINKTSKGFDLITVDPVADLTYLDFRQS